MNEFTQYTYLIFQLNGLIDLGKRLDIKEAMTRIEEGATFAFLEERFGDDIDLSPYDGEMRDVLSLFFTSINDAGNARRNFLVANDGLCLLIAYCTEGIQRPKAQYDVGGYHKKH